MSEGQSSLREDPRRKRVEVITSDGLRWETTALSTGDFDQTLYERRIIQVTSPGGNDDSWRVRTRHVVAFRVVDE